jgi:hypothetical protein
MISYKSHLIEPCSHQLTDGGWKPRAQVRKSSPKREHLKMINGEVGDMSSSKEAANQIAVKKAKAWINQL